MHRNHLPFPGLCEIFDSGLILRMRLSSFSRRQPLRCFPERWLCGCLRNPQVEEALAVIGRSETIQRALLMLHDTQIQVAGDANVKRAFMAAENVDMQDANS
jgi:hypothetical protein